MRGFMEILLLIVLLILIAVAAVIVIALVSGPYLSAARDLNISSPAIQPNASKPTVSISPGMARYYELKNRSCGTLSKDFLIVTQDSSEGEVSGLIEHADGELSLAKDFASAFDSNQTTRVYVRGDSMKRVVVNSSGETTTIWKDGRVYECGAACTMRLRNESDEKDYQSILSGMRSGCADFGRVELPRSVNMSRLLRIEEGATKKYGPFSCEDFKIYGNAAYANQILNGSSTSLDEDQKALLWGISRLSGPVDECLDEALGLVVRRELTLDLTKSYRFDYSPGGYMRIRQETSLGHYQSNVPESFLGLPGQE
jgi:hypothetical protein